MHNLPTPRVIARSSEAILPIMKKDISTRQDIEKMVDSFYTLVKKDDVIGYIFNEIVNLSWETHIPVMYNFWDTILLGSNTYKGNPMHAHMQLDKKETLQPKHYERWVKLFIQTIDELFEGDKAEEAKTRATNIMGLIAYKVEQSRDTNFVQ